MCAAGAADQDDTGSERLEAAAEHLLEALYVTACALEVRRIEQDGQIGLGPDQDDRRAGRTDHVGDVGGHLVEVERRERDRESSEELVPAGLPAKWRVGDVTQGAVAGAAKAPPHVRRFSEQPAIGVVDPDQLFRLHLTMIVVAS
jgi:hypothetical protein